MNKRCQVFTPESIVEDLLDYAGYKNNLYGKRVLENACGDGQILVGIVERYIKDCFLNKKSNKCIKMGLENDIVGIEIDECHQKTCIQNLDKVAHQYGIHGVSWNIVNEDTLEIQSDLTYDYIIGNPPYINYRDLDLKSREFVRDKFSTCEKGKFDYCYAFIEKSYNSLDANGVLAYLIPNSIFKNVFAEKLRELIKSEVKQIVDYTSNALFDVLTSSAILILQKGQITSNLIYSDIVASKEIKIPKSQLGKKWVFDLNTVSNEDDNNKKRFGDFYKASISIATQLNEAYVVKDFKDVGDYIETEGKKIEKGLMRKAYSVRGLASNKEELIIYPYYYSESELCRYSEREFYELFPYGSKYLEDFRTRLDKRKKDPKAKWFEYGRSQALSSLNQEKILVSTVLTSQVKTYHLGKKDIPYSGIFITPLNDSKLDDARVILESEEFNDYIFKIGTNANGKSYRITPSDINNYLYNE